MNDIIKLFPNLNIIIEDNEGIHIKSSNELKLDDYKKIIKILLYKIQSKEIKKDIILEFNNNLDELLRIIKFTGLLHCFKIIENNNLINKYPDLKVIEKDK